MVLVGGSIILLMMTSKAKIMTDTSLLDSYGVWAYLLSIQKALKSMIFLLLFFEETFLGQPCLPKCMQ